jgi:23S rRNA-intervening sequence protein
MKIQCAKDLIAYQKAYVLAMEIFQLTKKFPVTSLCTEIRRMLGSMLNNMHPFILKDPAGQRPKDWVQKEEGNGSS